MKNFEIKEILKGQKDSLEQLGTKEKFWFDEDEVKKLFKVGRPNTGEDWVEVVVSKICSLIDIPHAEYEFASYQGKQGTVTTNIVPQGGRLVHGNELLAKVYKKFDVEYKEDTFYKVREHNLQVIRLLLGHTSLKIKVALDVEMYKCLDTAFDMFIGYIILDCLISNQDRHHENWAVIVYDKVVYLSPTYDHASGLGSKETDNRKYERISTKDKNFTVEAFVKKAKTAFYDKGKILKTIDAVKLCAKENKTSTIFWLNKIDSLDIDDVIDIFEKIPKELISEISIEFAIKMLEINKKRLMQLKKELEDE
jgi:hypothetical protein